MKTYTAQVLLDANGRPLIVFGRGRLLYSAVVAGAGRGLADGQKKAGLNRPNAATGSVVLRCAGSRSGRVSGRAG